MGGMRLVPAPGIHLQLQGPLAGPRAQTQDPQQVLEAQTMAGLQEVPQALQVSKTNRFKMLRPSQGLLMMPPPSLPQFPPTQEAVHHLPCRSAAMLHLAFRNHLLERALKDQECFLVPRKQGRQGRLARASPLPLERWRGACWTQQVLAKPGSAEHRDQPTATESLPWPWSYDAAFLLPLHLSL